ncbi:helix-turn-helix domain-containing protein [Halapricum desulfuricans]|uniref:Transcriptional regulator, contains HTH domain n=1 Tax=Halapricum desulfuricans TaxID=2841257 RepID=A0A897NEH7_9EURY|nr:helix-turn-helix domain-containing protein [Halapricum desulfuricans]QSG08786.1 Transcriptional regulator, contains HTH domain [Halapricum desulfuricans]
MTVLLELSLPQSELSFGAALNAASEVRVRFEQIVPVGSGTFRYVWVNVPEQATFEEALQRHAVAESFQFLERESGELLYRIDWKAESDPFLRCLEAVGAAVLQAKGVGNRWHFHLRFDTRDDVSRFQRRCSEHDISTSIERILSDSAGGHASELLSPCQRRTIALALERGYFDVPRRTTMSELADELGISDQAVSARLRRATKRLGHRALSEELESDTSRDAGP